LEAVGVHRGASGSGRAGALRRAVGSSETRWTSKGKRLVPIGRKDWHAKRTWRV